LRKIASILLLIVFCNSFFYYTYFSFSIIKAKLEAAIAIGNLSAKKTYIKIPTAALQKDESDEVWYNNKLYDVAQRESVNDIEYVFLVRDEEEQDVLTQNSDYFKNDTGIFSSGGYKLSQQRKMQPITDNKYVGISSKKIFYFSHLLRPPTVKYTFSFISFCTDVPTPPPKKA
jgi:hypothetical protein